MNLKPRKIRGIESQAMVMCANAEEEGVTKIEVIDPPAGAVPGDIITVEGCVRHSHAIVLRTAQHMKRYIPVFLLP